MRALLIIAIAGCASTRVDRAPARPAPCPTPSTERAVVEPLEDDEASSKPARIVGTVVDQATREPIAGVTVIATSAAVSGSQTAITELAGTYAIGNLLRGTYTVAFYFGALTVERAGVPARGGHDTRLDVALDLAKAGGEAIVIEDRVDPSCVGDFPPADCSAGGYRRDLPAGLDAEPRPGDSIVAIVHDERDRPLAGVRITAIGSDGRWEATTDARGVARLSYLRPGRYDVLFTRDSMTDRWSDVAVESGSRTVLRHRMGRDASRGRCQ